MKYKITFVPQQWQNDYAIPVDPEGPTEWFASDAYVEEMRQSKNTHGESLWEECLKPNNFDSDAWRCDPAAPEWVRAWLGPYYCEVEEIEVASKFDFVGKDEDSGVEYRPWTDGWAVGFECRHSDGKVEYIYLNPSGGSDDGVPTVFVYQGIEAAPSSDSPQHHYVIDYYETYSDAGVEGGFGGTSPKYPNTDQGYELRQGKSHLVKQAAATLGLDYVEVPMAHPPAVEELAAEIEKLKLRLVYLETNTGRYGE